MDMHHLKLLLPHTDCKQVQIFCGGDRHYRNSCFNGNFDKGIFVGKKKSISNTEAKVADGS